MITLADMTPEQRWQCQGMWANVANEHYLAVIVVTYMADDVRTAQVLAPEIDDYYHASLETITPRYDLPRAWNPDGRPVPGEWADGHMWWGEDTDTMQTVDLVGAECLTTGQVQGLEEWPEGVTPGEDVPVRRFVSEWEDA